MPAEEERKVAVGHSPVTSTELLVVRPESETVVSVSCPLTSCVAGVAQVSDGWVG
ncbi:hypothetical protein GXW82_34195 [Streptacidiphilus sp. 4-A2]|nr:hypothetical protein [Streptacidiphilus sp. 4-A2]